MSRFLFLAVALAAGALAQGVKVPALPPGAALPPAAPALKVLKGELTPLPEQPTTLPNTLPSPSQMPKPAPAYTREPLWPAQWNMVQARMPQAWALLPAKPAPVTVAVLDTGYVTSAELGTRLVGGYDFVGNVARAGDGNGRDADATGVGAFAFHAAGVAEIIAAAHGGQGIAGINPWAKVVQVRVAGVDGMIERQDLIDGLRWAAGLPVAGAPKNPNPARIINLSLFVDWIPLTGCDAQVQRVIDEVTARGVTLVVGAANDDADAKKYTPAACRNVLTVTASNRWGQRPSYANWGSAVALAAPGGDPDTGIVVGGSGIEQGREVNGTSFAAPHVSGVASLLLAVKPTLTPAQIRDILTRTVTPFVGARCDPDPLKTCGRGILNAEAALREVLKVGP